MSCNNKTKYCNQKYQPSVIENLDICCELYSTKCIVHPDELSVLNMPENSRLQDILNILDTYLSTLAGGVQSDWTQEDEEAPDFIKNKPLNIIESIQAGDNVSIDNTDPQNPIISAEGEDVVLGFGLTKNINTGAIELGESAELAPGSGIFSHTIDITDTVLNIGADEITFLLNNLGVAGGNAKVIAMQLGSGLAGASLSMTHNTDDGTSSIRLSVNDGVGSPLTMSMLGGSNTIELGLVNRMSGAEAINNNEYTTLSQLQALDLQTITSVDNNTTNAINILGNNNSIIEDGMQLSKGSNSSLVTNWVGGDPTSQLFLGQNDISITLEGATILSLQNETPTIAGASVNSRMEGEDAINPSDFVTFRQVPSFSKPTWTLTFNTSFGDPTPITIDGVTFISSQQKYSIIDGIHFVSFRIRMQRSLMNPAQFSQFVLPSLPEGIPRAPAGVFYVLTSVLGGTWEKGTNNKLEDVNRFTALPYPGNSHARPWNIDGDNLTVEDLYNISDTQDTFFLDFRYIV